MPDRERLKISSLFKVPTSNFVYSLKPNGTKYFQIFQQSCEDICSSTILVHVATAGSDRGLSTVYIGHHWFHQTKLGKVVELQNTHKVNFISPPDVVQVNTLSPHLGLDQN